MRRLIIPILIIFLSTQQVTLAVDLGNGVDYIKPSKNLGIGTLNPPEKLSINGSLSIKEGSTPSNTGDFGKLYINPNTSNLHFLSPSGSNFDLLIPDSGSTGTSSKTEWDKVFPKKQLSPKDNSGQESIIIGGSNTSASDIILHKNGDAIFNEQGNNVNFRIAASGTDSAFFLQGSNGNIGINTNNPSSRLDVQNGAITLGRYPSNQKKLRLKGSFQDLVESANTLTLPTITVSAVNGNLLLALLTFNGDDGSTTASATAGWTKLSSITRGKAFTSEAWYKFREDVFDLTFTFSSSVDIAHGTLINFANGDTVTPFLDHSLHTGNSNDDEYFPVQDFQSTKDNTYIVRHFAIADESTEDTLGGPVSSHLTWSNVTDQKGPSTSLKTHVSYVFMDHSKWLSLNRGIVNGETYSMEPPSGFHDYTCGTFIVNPPDKSLNDPQISAFNTAIWLTDGSTSGDTGDLMAKTVTNAESKVFTLIDFDANGIPIQNGLTLNNLTPKRLVKTNSSKEIVSETEISSVNGSIGFGSSTPNELLTLEGRLSLREQGSSPSTSNGTVKLFVKSADSNLYILHDDGNEYDFNSVIGISGEWAETSNVLHPRDGSGEETVLIGGDSSSSADIILHNGGSAIFNELGKTANFRIEGDTDQNLFYASSANRIGIGKVNLNAKLDVNGAITASTINADTLIASTINSTNLTTNGIDLNFPNGAIIISDASGKLSHDANMLHWDNSNKRLRVDDHTAVETLTSNGAISLKEGAAPSNSSNYGKLYVKSTDSNLYFLDSAGTETDLLLETIPSLAINDLTDAKTNSNGLFMSSGSGTNDDGENFNTAIGANSSNINTTGQNNTTLGYFALYENDKSKNTAIGANAIRSLDNGEENVSIGAASAQNLENGNFNTFVGYFTYYSQNAGSKNTLIGDLIARQTTAFNNGTYMGYESGRNNTSGNANTALGHLALRNNFTGNNNTTLGRYSGLNINSNNNTIIGSLAGTDLISGSDNLILGYNNSSSSSSTSNQIDIANTIYGDSLSKDISIGINNQSGKLTVNGASALKVQGSDPSGTEGFGKVYVKSSDNKLYFIDNGGDSFDLIDNGDFSNTSEWIETFTTNIRPIDDTGERTLILGATGTASADIILYNGGSAVFNEQSNNADFRVESNNDANIFFADASIDSIGIGSNSVNGKLTLAGALSLKEISTPSNTSNYGKVYVDSTSSNLIFLDSNNIAFDLLNGSSATDEWTDIGSHLRPSDNSGSETVILGDTTIANADIILRANGSATFNENSSSVNFIVKSDNYTNMLVANGSTDRVGIRVSDPSSILEVNGKLHISNNLYVDDQIYFDASSQSGINFLDDRTQIIANGFTMIDITEAGSDSIDFNTGAFGFHFNNSSIFKADGTVGIDTGLGASSTPEKLTVNGSISFDNKSAADPGASADYGKLYVKNDNKLYYQNDASTVYEISKSAVDEWTDTGIGLHPKDSSGAEDLVLGGTSVAASDIHLELDGSAVFNEQGNAVNFRIESNDIDNMFFADGTNDRIGIATNSPSETLTINGAFALKENAALPNISNFGVLYVKSDSRPYLKDGSNQEYDLIDIVSQTFSSASIWVDNGSYFYAQDFNRDSIFIGGSTQLSSSAQIKSTGEANFNFEQNSSADFRIESNNKEYSFYLSGDNGCVGIGTDSPNQRLTVNGAIAFLPTNTNYAITDSDGIYGALKMSTDGNLKLLSTTPTTQEWFWLNNPYYKSGISLDKLYGGYSEYSSNHTLAVNNSHTTALSINAQHSIVLGNNALVNSSGSKKNIAIGSSSLSNLVSSNNNIAIGHETLKSLNTNNGNNIAIGNQSLDQLTDGENNVVITGYSPNWSTGSNNVLINSYAGPSSSYNNSVQLGYSAWPVASSITNGIILGSTNSAINNRIHLPSIEADTTLKTVKTNFHIGSSPSSSLANLFWIGDGDGMRLEPRASAPSSPAMGDIYVDSSGALCFYDGTSWDNIIGVDTDCS